MKYFQVIIIVLMLILTLWFVTPPLFLFTVFLFTLFLALYLAYCFIEDQALFYYSFFPLFAAFVIALYPYNPFMLSTVIKAEMLSFLALFMFTTESVNVFKHFDSTTLNFILKLDLLSVTITVLSILIFANFIIFETDIYTLSALVAISILLFYLFLREFRE